MQWRRGERGAVKVSTVRLIQLELARFLVEHGADAAAQDQCGSTPLHFAPSNSHFHVAQFLIEHSANAVSQATLQIQQSTTT